MDSDQEWCLECGAARTAVMPAPSPWVGLLVVAVVAAVVAIVALAVFA